MFGVELIRGEILLETFYRCLHPDNRQRVVDVWRHQLESQLPCDLDDRTLRPENST